MLEFACCSACYSRWSVMSCGLVVDGSCACAGVMVVVIEAVAAESGGMREEEV